MRKIIKSETKVFDCAGEEVCASLFFGFRAFAQIVGDNPLAVLSAAFLSLGTIISATPLIGVVPAGIIVGCALGYAKTGQRVMCALRRHFPSFIL